MCVSPGGMCELSAVSHSASKEKGCQTRGLDCQPNQTESSKPNAINMSYSLRWPLPQGFTCLSC